MLGQAGPAHQAHLLGIKEAEIHRLADVAVGFRPRLAHFKDLEGAKLETAAFHDGGDAFEKLCAFFERGGTPARPGGTGRGHGALRFLEPAGGDLADNLGRLPGVHGGEIFAGRKFFAADHERIFFAEAVSNLAQGRAHLFLVLRVDEVDHGRVFVGVAGERFAAGAVAAPVMFPRGGMKGIGTVIRGADQLIRVAQELNGGGVLGKFGAQEPLVRGVFEEASDEVGHAGEQLAHRAVFAHPVTHLDERAFNRAGHAVKELELEPAFLEAELGRESLGVGNGTDVVGTEGGGDDLLVLEQHAGAGLEAGVAFRFLQEDRAGPAVLSGPDLLVIPVGPLDEANGETRAALAAPGDQVAQVALGVAQVGLDDDAGVRPVAKFVLGEEGAEQLERRVFVRVAFHVEIDKGAEVACAPEEGTKPGSEVRDGVSRVGRVHLGVKG